MNRRRILCVATALCLGIMTACQSPARRSSAAPETSLPAEERKKLNVRKLRATLTGKPMKKVVQLLGQPSQVFALENREIWDYKNAAYDPVTGRTVRSLQILFVDRAVDSLNFSY